MARPTAAECAKYRTRHDEADLALHNLLTGTSTVELRMGEKAVKYTATSIGELKRYVAYLKDKVRECDGNCTAARRMIAVVPGDSR